jgi:hypothetical protein
MTNTVENKNPTSNSMAAKPQSTDETKHSVRKEIGARWSKFSGEDISAMKGKDDLVAQVVAKYAIEKVQAERDVSALLKDRQF